MRIRTQSQTDCICNPIASATTLQERRRTCPNRPRSSYRVLSDVDRTGRTAARRADLPDRAARICPTPAGYTPSGGSPATPAIQLLLTPSPFHPPQNRKNHTENRALPKTTPRNPVLTKSDHDPLQVVCTYEPHHNSTGVSGVFGVFWPSYTRVTPSMPSCKDHAVSPKHPEYPEHPGPSLPTPRSRPLLAWRHGVPATDSSLQNEDEPEP